LEQQRRRRAIRVVYHPVVVFQRITAVYHHFSQLLRIIINVLVLQNTIKPISANNPGYRRSTSSKQFFKSEFVYATTLPNVSSGNNGGLRNNPPNQLGGLAESAFSVRRYYTRLSTLSSFLSV
jgi:hypothetical protein